jgi:hypothetical protein
MKFKVAITTIMIFAILAVYFFGSSFKLGLDDHEKRITTIEHKLAIK